MHPDIGIVRMYRRSDGLSKRPEYQITRKPLLANPRYKRRPQGPALRPHYMESCPNTDLLYATSTSAASYTAPRVSAAVTIIASTASLRQDPSHFRIRYPMLAPSSESAVWCWQPFLT